MSDLSNLPPAAKLAALIEAGRAANPDLCHRTGSMRIIQGGTCALGFALLGGGASRDLLKKDGGDLNGAYMLVHGREKLNSLELEVMHSNDRGATLDEICASLREGELAKVPA